MGRTGLDWSGLVWSKLEMKMELELDWGLYMYAAR